MDKQIKSKQRVADHGEIFTNEREVNAMLDLVKQETERIESRFLEPACGEGAFLKEILRRKLEVVKNRYKKSPYDYERYAVLALTSIYGVDIMNPMPCQKRFTTASLIFVWTSVNGMVRSGWCGSRIRRKLSPTSPMKIRCS